MIRKRNLLCIKNRSDISMSELLLFLPYKNILQNLLTLCKTPDAKEFDPVYRAFIGLDVAPDDIKEANEASVGVTSYFHASKGGRAKYLEKKLSSLYEKTCYDLTLRDLPLFLSSPSLYAKKKIGDFLTDEEARLLQNVSFNWIGSKEDNVTFDIGTYFNENGLKRLTTIEVKNRVDSGGIAARREVWGQKKMGQILSLLESGKILYETPQTLLSSNQSFSLLSLLNEFNVEILEMNLGILYNVNGSNATLDGDRRHGFFGGNEEGYKSIEKRARDLNFEIIRTDSNFLELELKYQNLRIFCKNIYGLQIPQVMMRRDYPIEQLLTEQYDDMWLAYNLAIFERTNLLKYGINCILILDDILTTNSEISTMFTEIAQTEVTISDLQELTITMLSSFTERFEDRFFTVIESDEYEKESYLADIIQFYISALKS